MQNIKEIINSRKDSILEKLGRENLKALILIGSFARGEGVVCQNNGRMTIISDIEFLAVTKPSKFRKIKRLSNIASQDYKTSLGFTTEGHLKRLKPYIFTVEAKKFGKVLWGNDKVVDFIPNYSYEDIDSLDGFILLNNRIVEQLILYREIQKDKQIYNYEFNKGYIQIANSILAFNNQYRSLYSEKKEEFKKLFSNIRFLKEKTPDLLPKVEHALDVVRKTEFKTLTKEEGLSEWIKLRKFLKEVWLYEDSLFSISNDNKEELFKKFISLPDFKSRLKGWLKIIRNGQFRLNHLGYIFKTSPQFMIYQKAIKEYFTDEINTNECEKIIKLWENIVK